MKKNGFTFITIHASDRITPGVWNPYNYKYGQDNDLQPFSEYADILKVNGKKGETKFFDYAPIEYKHIPKGDLLTFTLEDKSLPNKGKHFFVDEDTLLFGTMRAYLGNACVTPMGDWINQRRGIKFAVNSEFVKILPFDNLKYFWWAYVKSEAFLREMPTGSGGTRPRVGLDLIKNIRVNVPNEKERFKINEKLKTLAQNSWSNYVQGKEVFKKIPTMRKIRILGS